MWGEMQRERITDDIYVFTSELYAQVTASAILTSKGAVLFDTLIYPEETRLIKRFIEGRLGAQVRYIINSHFHADHTTGTCFFEGATVISHARCRALLDERGRASLEHARTNSPEMREVELVLPQIVFDGGGLTLYLGNKTLQLWLSPGHSSDSIVCLAKEDRVLLAADTVIPIPYFVDGSYDDTLASLNQIRRRTNEFETIVQGHGEVVLPGEVEEKLESDLHYMTAIRESVDAALTARSPEQALEVIDIESCGKSRILLNGTVQRLHRQNVMALASLRRESMQPQ
ncbi:MAG: MBL fold metallo-hydrolase [Burkholderiales bacterium]|nr:MBL fold metallo-hydrolase [Anaerolineae bacterium]